FPMDWTGCGFCAGGCACGGACASGMRGLLASGCGLEACGGVVGGCTSAGSVEGLGLLAALVGTGSVMGCATLVTGDSTLGSGTVGRASVTVVIGCDASAGTGVASSGIHNSRPIVTATAATPAAIQPPLTAVPAAAPCPSWELICVQAEGSTSASCP